MINHFFHIHTFRSAILSRLLGIGYFRINLDDLVAQTGRYEYRYATLDLIHDNVYLEQQGWSFPNPK